MGATRRINGFVRLAALGAVAVVPVVIGARGAGGAGAGGEQPGSDPADTIKKMEEQRKKENPTPAQPTPPAAPAATPPAAAPPSARPPQGADAIVEPATTGTRLLRENTFITQRRGRMTRSMTSEWVFTMDSDGKGKSEPAMVLMPCMNLQNMEKTVDRAGEGTSFTVSGTVYVYKGRNYLLPSMYVVNRRSDLAPGQ
jgi:hypothetical protein